MLTYFKKYALYAFLAFCLFASSTPLIPNGLVLYVFGIFYCFFYSIRSRKGTKDSKLFWWLLVACYLASSVNMIFDYRLFIFTFVIITCSPILYSEKIFLFREKYLKCCLYAFPLISLICLYCYFKGINMMSLEDGEVSWDFSAIFPHSMWLGAAVGISNVVCLWNILNCRKRLYQILWTCVLLQSVYLSVVSASRSALVASLIAMFILILCNVKNVWKFVKYTIVAVVLVVIAFPTFYNNSQRMQNKMENSEGTYGSRTGIFTDGFNHFQEQPIFGCGFAVSYRDGHRNVGRLESGSGWLSILFQTGICGFAVMMLILNNVRKNMKGVRKDRNLQFYLFPFVFLCLHSFFEGYLLTSGYYLCLLFWTLLSYLYSYHSCPLENYNCMKNSII